MTSRKRFSIIMFFAVFLLAACGGAGSQSSEVGTYVVRDVNNEPVTLSLADGPILFIAYWCPHCETYLENAGLEQLPTVVSIFPQDGDTLQDVSEQTRAKLDRTGWPDTPFYISMNDPDKVAFTPSLAFLEGDEVKVVNPFELEPQQIQALMSGQ